MTPFETNHMSPALSIEGTNCKAILIFLRQSLDDKPANRWLRTALSYYTQSRYYLLAMRVDTPRLDLNGNAAGVVTQEQEDLAKTRLKSYPH